MRPEKTAVHRFDSEVQAWLFPQVLAIARRWLEDCVHCKDDTFPQLLLLIEFAHDAADRIYSAIVRGSNGSPDGPPSLRPILRPYDTIGSTRYVDFDTTRPVYATRADKCHVSHVVADTDSWEQKMAQTLEDMDEVIRYVEEPQPRLHDPLYVQRRRAPVPPRLRRRDRRRPRRLDPLNLIIEVTGEKKKEKAAKVVTARTLWVPAVNNHGAFGRWASSRSPTRGTPRAPSERRSNQAATTDGGMSMAKKKTARRNQGRVDPPQGQADEHPHRGAARLRRRRRGSARRRCSTPATRRSTRSSSGRARTSRTARTSPSPWCRSTSRRRSTPRRSSTTCWPRRRRASPKQQLTLFADFNGIEDFDKKIDFYHHDQHWSNRMILGDSLLVMTSLAEKEGLKGKVQMIYIDPPYGIKFGSNWQVSTRKRDVKDGKLEDATRQPEQIQAFRDTWKYGIHSYLPTCGTASSPPANCSPKPVASSSRSAMRMSIWCDAFWTRCSERRILFHLFPAQDHNDDGTIPSWHQRLLLWYGKNIAQQNTGQFTWKRSSGAQGHRTTIGSNSRTAVDAQ